MSNIQIDCDENFTSLCIKLNKHINWKTHEHLVANKISKTI